MSIDLTTDIAISFILRFLLAFIFFRAALHKLRHYREFCAQLNAYRLIPPPLVPSVALLLAMTEIYLACSLPLQYGTIPALTAASLLALYALAMIVNLLRGSADLDCGCGGPAAYRQRIGWPLVLRNGVLVLLCLASALPVDSHQLSVLSIGTIVAGSIAVIFIYISIELAITHQQRQRQYFSQGAPYQPDTSL